MNPGPLVLGAIVASLLAATLMACAAGVRAGGREATPGVPRISYVVGLPAPQTQTVEMTMTVADVTGPTLDVALPVWRPGRYAVLDMAGTVRAVQAEAADGRALAVHKVDKTTWRVETGGADRVTVRYRVYANALADRTRHVDDTHAFLSPAGVFFYVPGRTGEPLRVRVEAPEGWRVACGLDSDPADPRVLLAPDYDTLVDSPMEIGTHRLHSFEVDGVPHEIAVWGDAVYDADRLVRDSSAIVRAQRDIFGRLPYRRYLFILHIGGGAGGGTEHLNSFVAQGPREALEDTSPGGRYASFLGLLSHEMFHTWNVKQFRPAGLKPYDYARENYTDLLWVAEGTTSYYDDLVLVRAGLMAPDKYLEIVAGMIHEDRTRPGSLVQSLEESSYDAWVKFNRPTPDDPNSTVSFYTKGALASLVLDMRMRAAAPASPAGSMDGVMRTLFERFPHEGAGYTTTDLLATIRDGSGLDARPFLAAHVAGTEPMPYEDALATVGLEVYRKRADGELDEPVAYLGLRLQGGDRPTVSALLADGPAYASGLLVGDEVLALNGHRLRAGDYDKLLRRVKPGDRVRIDYFRRDTLRSVDIVATARPAGTWSVRRVENPSAAQRAAYESWLGKAWPAP